MADGNGSYLYVRNWQKFQHYKPRQPSWIKLYQSLLSDYEFQNLPDPVKLHLILIWLFASTHEGMVPNDADFIRRRVGTHRSPNLKFLIKQGYLLENASLGSRVEKSREEQKSQKPVDKSAGQHLRRMRDPSLYKKPSDLS